MKKSPDLIIFDIDATLIKPALYNSAEEIRQGLYDPQLLTSYLSNPSYQVGIASFNQDKAQTDSPPYGGRRLGRLILDVQDSSGDSRQTVEDEFIQAWMYPSVELANCHGKNEHIRRILVAYRSKYGHSPPSVTLYDDQADNVYLASKNGIRAYWVTRGLTRDNINTFIQLNNRVQFAAQDGQLEVCVRSELVPFAPYIYKHPRQPKTTPLYSLYLPFNREAAKSVYAEFLRRLQKCGVTIHIIMSDLNHIV